MAPTAAAESSELCAPPGAEYSDMNFDCMFKILLIGNSGVGKTSFLLQVCVHYLPNCCFLSLIARLQVTAVKVNYVKLQLVGQALPMKN